MFIEYKLKTESSANFCEAQIIYENDEYICLSGEFTITNLKKLDLEYLKVAQYSEQKSEENAHLEVKDGNN